MSYQYLNLSKLFSFPPEKRVKTKDKSSSPFIVETYYVNVIGASRAHGRCRVCGGASTQRHAGVMLVCGERKELQGGCELCITIPYPPYEEEVVASP